MKKNSLCSLSARRNGQIRDKKAGLTVPRTLHAAPGGEINIYFDNIILAPDSGELFFQVECQKGRHDADRWRFTPGDNDIGAFPLSLRVFDRNSKLLAGASTTVHVSPKDAGNDRGISLLMVGDSLTDASVYPGELCNLIRRAGGPDVKFIGTHAGIGKPPCGEHPAHEGYGGWTWGSFCSKHTDPPTEPAYRGGSSPFVFLKEGKPALDFKMYCDRKNEGNPPDYIIALLGVNDVFYASDSGIGKTVDDVIMNAETLLSEFRRVGPDTRIGVVVPPPPAVSQDAFGECYKCGRTRWQYRKNHHSLAERMLSDFSGREKEKIFIIPAHVNIDCVNNYPQKEEPVNARNPKKILRGCNGVHPAPEGYYQIADSVFAWLKYELNKKTAN
jgi:lysophospholipase L1-like esterase